MLGKLLEKTIDERIADFSYNRFIPFMMDYADFYGHKESRIVYDVYGVFELISTPPIPKLKMFASNKKSVSERTANRYLQLAKDVTAIRKMIRKELKNSKWMRVDNDQIYTSQYKLLNLHSKQEIQTGRKR